LPAPSWRAVRDHDDIAAEATWQALGTLIPAHWQELSADQSPVDSWSMLVRCAEMVLRIRRATRGDTGAAAADALEEFRALMREVIGEEGPEV
jgi:hypothetical protein